MTLPAYYLPPLSWFEQCLSEKDTKLKTGESIAIRLEAWEHFPKQTLRNRCYIDSPNGRIALSIPIDKTTFNDKGKCLMRDVRISKQYDWQHQHWQAFASSYFNSPFFEFLQDEFLPFYTRSWTFLIDLNEALLVKCFELLDVAVTIERTNDFAGAAEIPPSRGEAYYQVFAAKHGFTADLSIVDLLFNMGNESILYI